MTSNIGSDIILKAKSITDKVKEEIDQLLHQRFRPEFLNRIDAIVYFRMLTQEDVEKVATLQLNELKQRLAQKNIEVTFSPAAVKQIAELGYEKEFGARPLKRAISQHITVPISQFLLKNPQTQHIKVDIKNGKIVIS